MPHTGLMWRPQTNLDLEEKAVDSCSTSTIDQQSQHNFAVAYFSEVGKAVVVELAAVAAEATQFRPPVFRRHPDIGTEGTQRIEFQAE